MKQKTSATATKVLWKPNPGPQTRAYECLADELFYGGAAGAGKSSLLIGLAGTQHNKSVIFRRVFPLLRDLVEQSREVYNAQGNDRSKDSYNESLHLWRLVSGRIVEFGAIQHEKDKENQRGRPRDFYGWDELPQFTESQFRFVNAWNRSTRPGQRCRIVAVGNPPTERSGRWIIKYWGPWLDRTHPDPAAPGELRWFVRIRDKDVELTPEQGGRLQTGRPDPIEVDGELLEPRSRTFIPGRLDDTPQLRNTGYRAMLQGLPDVLKRQMLDGDFYAEDADDPWQIIRTDWVLAAQARWRDDWREDGKPAPLSAIGCDVARGGDDSTVIAKLYGWWVDELLTYPDLDDGPKVAAKVAEAWDGKAAIGIDVIGLGASPYDSLRGMNVSVDGINFGAGAGDETDKSGVFRFLNLRALGYWRLREALDPDGDIRLALPDDPELLGQLTAPTWKPTPRGIQVESKEDIKKRIGASPDKADAVVYAYLASLPKKEPEQPDIYMIQI